MTPAAWAVVIACMADPAAWAALVGSLQRWPPALTRRHCAPDSDDDPLAEQWEAANTANTPPPPEEIHDHPHP